MTSDDAYFAFLAAQEHHAMLERDLRRVELGLFRARLKALFEEVPELTSFAWIQGVLYNDCWHEYEMRVEEINGAEARPWTMYDNHDRSIGDNRAAKLPRDVDADMRWRYCGDPPQPAAGRALWLLFEDVYCDFGREFFRRTFGGCARVTVTRDAITVQLYDGLDMTPPLIDGAAAPSENFVKYY